ncbi:hypothetical protein [Lysobacter sp. yr284]|uniref:hypothetical protein n=1 Tax=Lysobacter sp. yr284 TaxID=1761791 RepID=UPI0011145076|nr:hypothetical protein [Lysobacter sp. yr284]
MTIENARIDVNGASAFRLARSLPLDAIANSFSVRRRSSDSADRYRILELQAENLRFDKTKVPAERNGASERIDGDRIACLPHPASSAVNDSPVLQ